MEMFSIVNDIVDEIVTCGRVFTELHSRASAGYFCQNHIPQTEILDSNDSFSTSSKNVVQKCPIRHNTVLDVVLSEGGKFKLPLHCCISSKNNASDTAQIFTMRTQVQLEKHIKMCHK